MIHSKNRNKGYTLIELMVVVGIIALLLGLSLNGLNNLIQWNKLNVAAALLSSELKNTQSMAFYEGIYYKIDFWESLDRYRIYKQKEVYYEVYKDIQLEDIDLFNTNYTDDKVYFYPNGVPSMGGTVTLKNKIRKV
ncbi:MAG: hypothetical protein CO097_04880, partial [Candidatus Infernicultor aquiphilus]